MAQALAHYLGRAIHLEAVDRPRNIARRYVIDASRDLFGAVIVDFGWGRIGTRGQSRVVSFSCDDDAERFVRTLLRRRSSARRRLGVDYCEVHKS